MKQRLTPEQVLPRRALWARVPSGKIGRAEMAKQLGIPNTKENAAKLDYFIAELPGSNFICHQGCVYLPNGDIEWGEPVWPIGKVKPHRKLYCKYCYKTHTDWYQMNPADYSLGLDEPVDVILCGNCGHTSRKESAQCNEPRIRKAREAKI